MYEGGYLIGQINKLTNRRINELLKKYDIDEFNGAQGTILYSLWEKDGLTIKEISGITGLAKSSLTSMLERMRDKGLIHVNVNPADRRSKIVKLSPGAKELEKEFDLVTSSMFENYYKGFSEAEVVQFENQLRRILKNLEEAK